MVARERRAERAVGARRSPAPPGAALAIPDAAEPATVNDVHDGDTIFLDTPRDSDLKVSLLAIDTPEIDTPEIGTPAIGTPGIGTPAIGTPKIGTPKIGNNAECFGDEARDYLRDALPGGSTVYTLADTDETDQYGRALLFVYASD